MGFNPLEVGLVGLLGLLFGDKEVAEVLCFHFFVNLKNNSNEVWSIF